MRILRQGCRKHGAFSRRAVNRNFTPMGLEDMVTGGKSDANTLSQGFGREKRFKQLVYIIRVNAGTIVCHFQNNPVIIFAAGAQYDLTRVCLDGIQRISTRLRMTCSNSAGLPWIAGKSRASARVIISGGSCFNR